MAYSRDVKGVKVPENGIEFQVRSGTEREHFGDLVVMGDGLVWCKGRTRPENGVQVSWEQFINLMEG